MVQDGLDVLGGEVRKDGNDDGAHGCDRKIGDSPVGGVLAKDGHLVTLGDSKLLELGGEGAHPSAQFEVGEALPFDVGQGCSVGVAADRLFQQLFDGSFRVTEHEVVQWVVHAENYTSS